MNTETQSIAQRGLREKQECTHYAYCFAQPLFYKVVNEQARAQALRTATGVVHV